MKIGWKSYIQIAQRDFVSSIINLNYKNSEIELGIEAKYYDKGK